MRRLIALALASTILGGPAWALDPPTPGKQDVRMQTAAYSPSQIYPLTLEIGHTMSVTVSDKETITDIWGSDSADLKADPAGRYAFFKAQRTFSPRSVFLKTRCEDGSTRLYTFQAQAVEQGADSDTYNLTFRYPSDEAAARRAAWAQAAAEREKALAAQKLAQAQAVDPNYRYVLQGLTAADWNLLPTRQVYDDGSTTFFVFPGSMRVPVIYTVNPDGQEAVAAYVFNSQTGIAEIHQLGTQWRLRDGDAELCIFNHAYNPVGLPNTTGTRNSEVQRVLK